MYKIAYIKSQHICTQKHGDALAAVKYFDALKKYKKMLTKRKSNPGNSATNIIEIFFL